MAASDAPDGVKQAWPQKFELARQLESNGLIRYIFRVNRGKLLEWVKPTLVGVASLRALGLNKLAVQLSLKCWCENSAVPKSPPVDWLKQEAWHAACSTQGIVHIGRLHIKSILPLGGDRALQLAQCW